MIVGVAFIGVLVKHGSLRIPVLVGFFTREACTREAFRDLPASRPPPVAAAASAEPSLLPPPSSRPRRSTSEVQRRPAATPVVARRFGSTQGAPRRPSCQPALSATLPLRMTTSVLSQALRTPRAGQLPLIINWISLWPLQVTLSVHSAAVHPHSHPRSLSTSTTLTSHLSRGVRKLMNTVSYS